MLYLTATDAKVDTDEGRFTLVVACDDIEDVTIDLHGIDLDAFYDSVKLNLGAYLRERDEALAIGRDQWHTAEEIDQSMRDAYDRADPKHPDWHSVHADLYDNRDKFDGK